MRFLTWIAPLFWALRRQADSIEALGEDQKRRLVQGGLDANRIGVHRLGSPIHIPQDAQPAPRPFAHTDFVLLYSGNLGVAHEIETLCEAYRRHVVEGSNRVRLWVNGRGARLGELEAYCRKHNLPLALTPPAPLSQLPNLLKAADAHLVLLHAHFWGLVHPSKVYACIDAGQPILYVGPREADAAQLIMQNAGSAQIDPGDVDACFWTLESFAEEQEAKTPRRCAAVQGAPLGSQAPFVEVRSFSDYQADEVGE